MPDNRHLHRPGEHFAAKAAPTRPGPAGRAGGQAPAPGRASGRHWLLALLLLPLLWLGASAVAAEGDLQPVPELRAPVTDLTNTLAPADRERLNARLLAFSQEKGSQIGVLLVPTTAPEDIFTYSFRVAEKWKLGRKGVDDGLLLVIAVNDRKTHLQVGYGLEGAIPDLRANQIVDDILPPYFRRGDFAGGIDAATDTMIRLIRGENLPLPQQRSRQGMGSGQEGPGGAVMLALIAGIIASLIARAILGRFLGGMAGGGVAFAVALALGVAFGMAVFIAIFAMFFAGGRGGVFPGGFGHGGFGRGGFGGGGFGGGGGGFGGGGASGSW